VNKVQLLRTISRICLFLFLIVPWSLVSGSDQSLVLKNAKIYTMGKQGVLETGMLLIKGGKIEEVGQDITYPSEAEVIDLEGRVLIPGIVCASSSLFIHEQDLIYPGEETPDTDVLEGIQYYDPSIPDILKYGLTTAYISPPSFQHIGGLGAVVKLSSKESPHITILREKAALNFRLERLRNRKTSNVLRLTQYHKIRNKFKEAQEYKKEWKDYEKKFEEYEEEKKKLEDKKEEKPKKEAGEETAGPKKPQEPKKPKRDAAKEILLQAMEKKIPVRFMVHRPDSILQAIRLGKEFGLKVVLERGEEWEVLLPALERASVRLLSNPLLDYRKFLIPGGEKGYGSSLLRIREGELFYSDETSPSEEQEKGKWMELASSQVPFALIPPDHFPYSARFMRFYAGFLVKKGIDPESALRAMTSAAAEILGVDDRVGSLEAGKDADMVVLNGEPLNSLSIVDLVYVDGSVVWKRER
jgi:imidazolonepropionase-like amidohydrolase